jgi:hypothetical protein
VSGVRIPVGCISSSSTLGAVMMSDTPHEDEAPTAAEVYNPVARAYAASTKARTRGVNYRRKHWDSESDEESAAADDMEDEAQPTESESHRAKSFSGGGSGLVQSYKRQKLSHAEVERERERADVDIEPKLRRSKHPIRATIVLRQYFMSHVDHPYPTDEMKGELAESTRLSVKQINDWFTNCRKVSLCTRIRAVNRYSSTFRSLM